MTKTCKDCGNIKDVSDYYLSNSTWDGYRDVCKVCDKDISARVYRSTKDERIMKILEWQIDNAEKVKAYKRKYKQKEKHERNKRKSQECNGESN